MPVLRVDARFTVIESCLKGYMKWRKQHKDEPEAVSSMVGAQCVATANI
jgi:exportin-5